MGAGRSKNANMNNKGPFNFQNPYSFRFFPELQTIMCTTSISISPVINPLNELNMCGYGLNSLGNSSGFRFENKLLNKFGGFPFVFNSNLLCNYSNYSVPVPVPVPVKVPVPVQQPVPIMQPCPVPVPVKIPVEVPVKYPVEVPQPCPVNNS